ncbi:MAG TPA: hypothetical protein VG708_14745, partial [Mycobacteriales bacterium]|nr:hypothetical protein [Mycobacteriales bacterium]
MNAIGRALAINRAGFEPVAAVRAAAGIAIPLAIGAGLNHPAEGAIAAAGALPAGVASMSGGFRSRVPLVAVTSLGMAISTFAGGLVAGHFGWLLAALAVWGFVGGIAVVLGRDASIVGIQAIIGLAVFGRFPAGVPTSAGHAGWVLAGGALQGLLSATIRPPRRFVTERHALAHALAELARLAHRPTASALDAAGAIQVAADLVARRNPDDAVDLLRSVADEAARIRLELQSLGTITSVGAAQEATRAAAGWLRRASQALAAGSAPPEEDPALATVVDRLA